MVYRTIEIRSHKREEFINITLQIENIMREVEIANGRITIFIPHTTAAVTINENADPDVPRDLTYALNKIIPNFPVFRHMEGNSDAHTKSTLVGNTQDLFFKDKRLLLGTWQGIFFCEFDGPRSRRAQVFIQEL